MVNKNHWLLSSMLSLLTWPKGTILSGIYRKIFNERLQFRSDSVQVMFGRKPLLLRPVRSCQHLDDRNYPEASHFPNS